ncbi:MAG: hypothetical protein K5989_10085 [Lachnospiraceae bacterium]|nr:hypothetical protein [Lachnospiraceae bacterium]
MNRQQIEKKFADIVRPVAENNDFSLIKTEYVQEGGNYFLRAFLDKPGGITIDDCVLVSRIVSKQLDKEDFIEEAYTMEISSPGFMSEPENGLTEGDADS